MEFLWNWKARIEGEREVISFFSANDDQALFVKLHKNNSDCTIDGIKILATKQHFVYLTSSPCHQSSVGREGPKGKASSPGCLEIGQKRYGCNFEGAILHEYAHGLWVSLGAGGGGALVSLVAASAVPS